MDISDADFTLWGSISGLEERGISGVPQGTYLEIKGGNPLGSGSSIVFGIPAPSHVRLGIYDVTGRRVADVIDGHLPEGYHSLPWREDVAGATGLSPGIYFLRLDSESGGRTAKAVVAR
jgi:hypothetical protein